MRNPGTGRTISLPVALDHEWRCAMSHGGGRAGKRYRICKPLSTLLLLRAEPSDLVPVGRGWQLRLVDPGGADRGVSVVPLLRSSRMER